MPTGQSLRVLRPATTAAYLRSAGDSSCRSLSQLRLAYLLLQDATLELGLRLLQLNRICAFMALFCASSAL